MTYIVNEKCIKCKYTDCVAVCPVDCFHEGENMLVINPEECIDCGVCVDECPVNAIEPEREELMEWLEINKKYSNQWPILASVLDPLEEAEEYKTIENKKMFLSSKAGNGKKIRKTLKYSQ